MDSLKVTIDQARYIKKTISFCSLFHAISLMPTLFLLVQPFQSWITVTEFLLLCTRTMVCGFLNSYLGISSLVGDVTISPRLHFFLTFNRTFCCWSRIIIFTGSNFDDDEKKTTGGRNGYGAKLANIFSSEFIVETADSSSGQKFKQVFEANMTVRKDPKITSVIQIW